MIPGVAPGLPRSEALGGDRLQKWAAVAGLAACALTLWMLGHGYEGIIHDAQLYSFQAMARVKPGLLGNDIYLRFGSQDDYTIFSRLYAALIARLGFEPAAALLTLISHTIFLSAAWVLARRLMSRNLAWLALGLLLTVPSVYAAYGVWSFFEGFVTPRLACEALVLAALAAMLAERPWLACLCFATGTLLHPLMSAPGIVVALYIRFMPLRPSVAVSGLLLACVTLVAVLVAPAEWHLRFDEEWLSLIRERQQFLFPSSWRLEDWARAAMHFTTLVVGVLTLPRVSASRKLCAAALVTGLTGLLISWIGGDILKVVLIIQAQPWRWMWMSAVLAVLLIPIIATQCWQLGRLGKLALVLVAIAWLSLDEPYTALLAPFAIAAAAAAVSGKRAPDRIERVLLAGGVVLLSVVVIRSFANSILFAGALPDESFAPVLVRQIRALSRDGVLPTAVFVSAWWLFTSYRSAAGRLGLAATWVIACVALVPASVAGWEHLEFTKREFDAFASWREHIPPGKEVLWIDGSVPTWALLERPGYLSANQTASMLFSRRAAMELKRRALQLAPFAKDENFIFWKDDALLTQNGARPTLASLCQAIDAPFIVTRSKLDPHPLATVPVTASLTYRGLQLFQCAR